MVARKLLVAVALLVFAAPARAQERDSALDRALAHPDFTWHSLSEGGVRLYYQPGSFAERHRVMLVRSAQAAVAAGLAFLGLDADARELRVLYVDDRAQMKTLIGSPYAGLAEAASLGVFLVCNPEWRSFDTHEITHILSLSRWGNPDAGSTWMIEGLPNAVDGQCRTADVDRIASYLMAAGRWPGLSAFTANASALGEVPAGMFAASLLRFLREQYGAAIIEEIWRSGLTAALTARTLDPAHVEAQWRDALRDVAKPLTDEEWKKIDEDGCG